MALTMVLGEGSHGEVCIFYGRGGDMATNRLEDQEMAMLALHLLQISLVYINTLMVQQIFTDDTWFERMTPEDFRGICRTCRF